MESLKAIPKFTEFCRKEEAQLLFGAGFEP